MEDIDKQGEFYLGRRVDPSSGQTQAEPVLLPSKDLTTHAVCIGMTGSGKTGLGIALLEEAAMDGIPALIIDPKGDLGNLLLTFPNLAKSDFLPWIDPGEAERQGMPADDYAAKVAADWQAGIESWGQTPQRMRTLKNAVDFAIYTPASQAGIPLSILNSFAAPPQELVDDAEALRDRILSTTSSLLGLLGINADPIKSREHILLSTLLDKAWRAQRHLDLPALIQQIQTPPIDKIGVFSMDAFFPAKERLELSMKLNNLLASPGFQAWMEGAALDIQQLLYGKDGRPRHAVIAISHLSDNERMFFVTLLLNEVVSWMRRQPGTSSLRALLFMDEIFGFFPPTAMPSSKIPMLTLLKQARAFGLGIVLTTQNPVDLDYKGLANCGTWFIGKLQTDRDKARVIEGLKTTVSGEAQGHSFTNLLAACTKRVFLLHSIHLPAPVLFQTRWTLSYLRGPLTLPNIRTLMNTKPNDAPTTTPKNDLYASAPSFQGKGLALADIPEYYRASATFKSAGKFMPSVICFVKLHFDDAKIGIDSWQDKVLVFPMGKDGQEPDWTDVKDFSAAKAQLSTTPPQSATYAAVPGCFGATKSCHALVKPLTLALYQNQVLEILTAPELKLTSKPDESEAAFRQRLDGAMQEKCAAALAKECQSYDAKLATLQEKIRRVQLKKAQGQQQLFSQRLLAWISFATTLCGAILGALFGKKRISQTTISQTGTSIRRVTRVGQEQQELSYAESSLEELQQQCQELTKARAAALDKIKAELDASKIPLEKLQIHPRKADIAITTLGIFWERNEEN